MKPYLARSTIGRVLGAYDTGPGEKLLAIELALLNERTLATVRYQCGSRFFP